ncbi:hypothetical protein EGR_06197 [Echinococcus granulosus]|uniref:Uncharacterized protein n=1 Tax=Echinococcus granulosus TaxID=6210 RepID=W6UDB1_ECHGR|nr:hypothetical protein EGR_06197 [Echinococcus granulosus]EUB58978.1 hypothetical protein EGR_06197 [Echinococcus granulosus]
MSDTSNKTPNPKESPPSQNADATTEPDSCGNAVDPPVSEKEYLNECFSFLFYLQILDVFTLFLSTYLFDEHFLNFSNNQTPKEPFEQGCEIPAAQSYRSHMHENTR